MKYGLQRPYEDHTIWDSIATSFRAFSQFVSTKSCSSTRRDSFSEESDEDSGCRAHIPFTPIARRSDDKREWHSKQSAESDTQIRKRLQMHDTKDE